MENYYLKMVYKPYENKEEKKEKMEKLRLEREFYLNDEKEYTKDVLRILGKYFVKKNKIRCKVIYKNKIHELKEYLEEIDNNYNKESKEIKIKLVGINNIGNMMGMFCGCYHLTSVSEYQKNKYQTKNKEQIKILYEPDEYSSIYEEGIYNYLNTEINSVFSPFNELLEVNKHTNDIYEGCYQSTLIFSNIQTNNNNSNLFIKKIKI